MAVTSLAIDATPGKVRAVAQSMANIPGVTVYNSEGYRILAIIDEPNARAAQKLIDTISDISGVIGVNPIYREPCNG